jgi:hypothetical protein
LAPGNRSAISESTSGGATTTSLATSAGGGFTTFAAVDDVVAVLKGEFYVEKINSENNFATGRKEKEEKTRTRFSERRLPIAGEDCVAAAAVAVAVTVDGAFGVLDGDALVARRRVLFGESVCCLQTLTINQHSSAKRKTTTIRQNLRIRFTSFLIIERGDSCAPRFFNALKNEASDCNSSTNGLSMNGAMGSAKSPKLVWNDRS